MPSTTCLTIQVFFLTNVVWSGCPGKGLRLVRKTLQIQGSIYKINNEMDLDNQLYSLLIVVASTPSVSFPEIRQRGLLASLPTLSLASLRLRFGKQCISRFEQTTKDSLVASGPPIASIDIADKTGSTLQPPTGRFPGVVTDERPRSVAR